MFFVKSNAFKSYYTIYMVRELTNPLTTTEKSTFTFCFLKDESILHYWFKFCLPVFVREHITKKKSSPSIKKKKKKAISWISECDTTLKHLCNFINLANIF